jgi:acetaldehyde dehydrogenase
VTPARLPCAILGSGNIGTDLMYKLIRSEKLELTAMVGIDPESDGLARARRAGLDTSAEGVEWILSHREQAQLVFEATSAEAHVANAPRIIASGARMIDLTPAKLGRTVVPAVNADNCDDVDINLTTCGGQATIPIVAAVSGVVHVSYAEIVATISSRSAGPGTRESIDAFTRTTAQGLTEIGGADRGKAIIVLNPAEPPILMRNTVYCAIPVDADQAAIAAAVHAMAATVASYVPGYRLRGEPVFDAGRVAVFVEVEGAGDYLPEYAGNLDIMTAAATAVGERLAAA